MTDRAAQSQPDEPEEIMVRFTLDTSRFTQGLTDAAFWFWARYGLPIEDRMELEALGRAADAYQDFEASMREVRRLLGEE